MHKNPTKHAFPFCHEIPQSYINMKKDILCRYNVPKRVAKLWMVHGSLPIQENFKRTCHIMRKNTIGLDRLTRNMLDKYFVRDICRLMLNTMKIRNIPFCQDEKKELR